MLTMNRKKTSPGRPATRMALMGRIQRDELAGLVQAASALLRDTQGIEQDTRGKEITESDLEDRLLIIGHRFDVLIEQAIHHKATYLALIRLRTLLYQQKLDPE